MTEDITPEIDTSRLSRDYKAVPWKRGEQPNVGDFRYLYLELNLSQEEIGEYLNLSKHYISSLVQKMGLKKTLKQRQESRERMNLKKLGVKHPIATKEIQDKVKQTNMDKYGTDCVLKLERTREKGRATMRERYGAEYALQVPEFMEKQRQTNLDHWGVEYTTQSTEVQEKMKKSTEENYGVDNVFKLSEMQEKARQKRMEKFGTAITMHVPEIREKVEDTCLKKYGAKSALSTPAIRAQILNTLQDKYGVDHVSRIPGVQDTIKQTRIEKYGTPHTAQIHVKHIEDFNPEYWIEHFVDKRSNYFDVAKCAEYHGVSSSTITKHKKAFNIQVRSKYSSVSEQEIADWLVSIGINPERRVKTLIEKQEIDLYLKDYNVAIEYDGLLYHSQGAPLKIDCDKSSTYHLNKTELCERAGVQLLHIFENEWLNTNTREIWKSIILSKIGKSEKIHARKTTLCKVSADEASRFCQENHLQGACPSKIKLGLRYQGELVALMTFGKPRFNKDYTWELLRYCNRKGFTVVGGASKLLKHFRQIYTGSIISYANRRWSNGKLYETLGFSKKDVSKPNYFYFKLKNYRNVYNTGLESRQRYQKHKLKDLLESFDENLTEAENMFANGYRRIFDCGNIVYVVKDN